MVGWAATMKNLLALRAPFLPPDRVVAEDARLMKNVWFNRAKKLRGKPHHSEA